MTWWSFLGGVVLGAALGGGLMWWLANGVFSYVATTYIVYKKPDPCIKASDDLPGPS